jgi:hypothetical protein
MLVSPCACVCADTRLEGGHESRVHLSPLGTLGHGGVVGESSDSRVAVVVCVCYDGDQEEIKERDRQTFSLFSQQASLGVNLIVTLLTAVACGYYIGRAWFGVESDKVGWWSVWRARPAVPLFPFYFSPSLRAQEPLPLPRWGGGGVGGPPYPVWFCMLPTSPPPVVVPVPFLPVCVCALSLSPALDDGSRVWHSHADY